MNSSTNPRLPRKKIPAVPSVVELEDLGDNLRLLTDTQIQSLRENTPRLATGRNKKAYLSETLGMEFEYDIAYLENEFFAIYLGLSSNRHLGSGSFGKVKVAQNVITGEWVALKIVGDYLHKTINNEIPILYKVGQGIGWYQRENKEGLQQLEIFMKLAPGLPLRAYINNNVIFSPVEYLEIIINILESCDRLIKSGILHRDIKASNIMFDLVSNILTFIDYGLSVELNEQGDYQSKPGAGSRGYRAPEINGKDRSRRRKHKEVFYNVKTEIFAIAVVILKLLGIELETEILAIAVVTVKLLGVKLESDVQNALAEKIPDYIDQLSIFNILGSMINDNPDRRPDINDTLTPFRKIYDNLNDVSRVITVACIDLQCYGADIFDDNNSPIQKKYIDWFARMQRVCLVDSDSDNPCTALNYVQCKRFLESMGLNVLDEVVYYDSQNRENGMPAAVASYLKHLPNAATRHYVGWFILDNDDVCSPELGRALTHNGLMYANINQNLFKPSVFKSVGASVNPEIVESVFEEIRRELNRLEQKPLTEKRQKKMNVLEKSLIDINLSSSVGLSRVGLFRNIFYRLEYSLGHAEKSTTYRAAKKAFSLIK